MQQTGGLSVEARVEHSQCIGMRAVAGGAGRTGGQVRIGSSGTLDMAALSPARVAAMVGSGALEGSALCSSRACDIGATLPVVAPLLSHHFRCVCKVGCSRVLGNSSIFMMPLPITWQILFLGGNRKPQREAMFPSNFGGGRARGLVNEVQDRQNLGVDGGVLAIFVSTCTTIGWGWGGNL